MTIISQVERLPRNMQPPIVAIFIGFTYYLSALYGISLSFKPDFIAALWPPNAILLSALLLSKPKLWPWFLLATIPAELAADIPSGISLKMAIGFIISDWIEALTAAILFRYFYSDTPKFCTLKQTSIFIFCCTIIAPFVAAFPGAFVTGVNHIEPSYFTRWSQWFVSEALTHLLITPFILLLLQLEFSKIKSFSFSYFLELFIFATLLIGAGITAFTKYLVNIESFTALVYLPLPVLLWASIRFNPFGLFTSSLFIANLCVWSSSNNLGPFIADSNAMNVINLQIFLAITITPMVLLVALAAEYRKSKEQLQKREEQYRFLFYNNISMMMILDPVTGTIIDVNPAACSYYGYPKEKFAGMNIARVNTLPKKQLRREMLKAKSEEKQHFNFKHRLFDGSIRDVEVFSGPIVLDGKTVLCNVIHDISERKEEANRRELLISTLEKALTEVKTLRGFIPICASCKMIRDDKGYWNQIEAYISAHSEAEFSHSICPNCVKKLYPELKI